MASQSEIKSRIKAVKSTAKITKAMQMISASKMTKAQTRARAATPYAQALLDMLNGIGTTDLEKNEFLVERPHNNICMVIVGPSRGFVGGMMTALRIQVIKFHEKLKKERPEVKMTTITLHKGGMKVSLGSAIQPEYHFAEFVDNPTTSDITAIKKVIIDSYLEHKYDQIYLAYTKFISTMNQQPTIQKLMPIKFDVSIEKEQKGLLKDFVIEPNAKAVLDILIPEYIENQIFSALLNNLASEHSARMVAMKNATDNANTLNENLTLSYNRTRQANITKQIIEVASAAKQRKSQKDPLGK